MERKVTRTQKTTVRSRLFLTNEDILALLLKSGNLGKVETGTIFDIYVEGYRNDVTVNDAHPVTVEWSETIATVEDVV